MSQDERYMRRCLELALLAKGATGSNPLVGAVLVHNGRVIGEGWHRAYGGPHAEINCLASVAAEDRHLIPESTMYVSLEPCSHQGKTPPCAVRLAEEKVRHVVVCNSDPFPQVQGRGVQMLRDAGIAVTEGLMEAAGRWVNRRFFCFHEQRRPYIILKWAQTRQGFFAPADRSRLQISNAHSRQLVHRWRSEEAAIMVGYRTALHDNPQLTARLWQGAQPLRIVLDRDLSLPAELELFNADAPTWVVNTRTEEVSESVTRVKLAFDDTPLPALLQRLHDVGRLSLIVEGGAATLQRFIDMGLWDEARVFSTGASVERGIPAPSLSGSVPAFSTPIGTDVLHVFTHAQSAYPYVAGMAL